MKSEKCTIEKRGTKFARPENARMAELNET